MHRAPSGRIFWEWYIAVLWIEVKKFKRKHLDHISFEFWCLIIFPLALMCFIFSVSMKVVEKEVSKPLTFYSVPGEYVDIDNFKTTLNSPRGWGNLSGIKSYEYKISDQGIIQTDTWIWIGQRWIKEERKE